MEMESSKTTNIVMMVHSMELQDTVTQPVHDMFLIVQNAETVRLKMESYVTMDHTTDNKDTVTRHVTDMYHTIQFAVMVS